MSEDKPVGAVAWKYYTIEGIKKMCEGRIVKLQEILDYVESRGYSRKWGVNQLVRLERMGLIHIHSGKSLGETYVCDAKIISTIAWEKLTKKQ